MPKLFQICVEGNSGTVGRIAETLGEFAIQNGWESYIAYGRSTRPSKSHLIRIGSNFDIYLHGLQTRILDRHGLGSVQSTEKLIGQISEIKPDVIHLHSLHGYYINIRVLFDFLATASIPVVWTLHDCWSFTGHCPHFDYIGCEKWRTECNHCPQKEGYPASLFADHSKTNYYLKKTLFTSVKNMTIVSVSNWLGDLVKQSFLSSIPQKTIYNGIDLSLFTPGADTAEIRNRLGIGEKFMILGVASPWGKRKGLAKFRELNGRLAKDEVIVLVGLNVEQIAGLPSGIIGLPRTENQAELKDLYSTADVFLNLSLEESFGLTTVESLACGTPAVVKNSTASPEIVGNDSCVIVEKGDTEGLLATIATIKRNGKAYYSAKCRERAEQLFNVDDHLPEYLGLYHSIVTLASQNSSTSSSKS